MFVRGHTPDLGGFPFLHLGNKKEVLPKKTPSGKLKKTPRGLKGKQIVKRQKKGGPKTSPGGIKTFLEENGKRCERNSSQKGKPLLKWGSQRKKS